MWSIKRANDFLDRNKLKWEEDGITNGSITFLRLPNEKFDIITKDAMSAFSYAGDSAKIVG